MKDTYRMMHFTPGKEVWYNGAFSTVSHVLLKNMELYVRLDGVTTPVNSKEVSCEPTVFVLKRKE